MTACNRTPAIDLRGRRILVADDNSVNRQVLYLLLAAEGAQIHLACDGEEAIAVAMSQQFDVVLMDISMPRLNGYDATRRIRAHAQVPIIGVTGHDSPCDRERCVAAGMNGSITKPVRRSHLLAAIAAALS